MEVISKNQFKTFFIIIIIIIFTTTIIPVAIYYYNFKSLEISSSPNDWASFGGYVSGVIGTIFTLLAVIFSLISIYITIKIAENIQKREEKINAYYPLVKSTPTQNCP